MVFGLAMDAFNVRAYRLSFGDVDIMARASGQGVPGVDDLRAMLRNLLAERFKLSVHRETREVPNGT